MSRRTSHRKSVLIACLQALLLFTWPAAQASSTRTPVPLLPLPKDPAAVAATLSRIETALRNRATSASEQLEMSHLQQRLYRRLGRNRGLAAAVRPLLPLDLRAAFDHHISARQALEAMVPAGRPPLATVPAWRIIQPASAEALLASYRRAAAATGVPWQVLAAVNLVETGMGRLDGVSVANAQGPMQFLPSTWAERGIGRGNIRNPDDAIQAAARYLVRRGARQDLRRGLWGYNNSVHYGTAVLQYASLLRTQPAAFASLYHWQIHLRTTVGDLWLPVGTQITRPMAAADFVRLKPWSRSD